MNKTDCKSRSRDPMSSQRKTALVAGIFRAALVVKGFKAAALLSV